MGQYANQMLMKWISQLMERHYEKKKQKQESAYESIIYLIPDEIEFVLTDAHIEQIKLLLGVGNPMEIERNQEVEFADAGEDFEAVRCLC